MLAKNPLQLVISASGWLQHLIHSSHLLNTSTDYCHPLCDWDMGDFRRRLGTGRYLRSGAESTALSGDMFPGPVGTFSKKKQVSPVLNTPRTARQLDAKT